MILSMRMRNIALIEELSLEFGEGLHVMTGETGAGKSIVVDAVNLVLGGRAARELIRTGTDKARSKRCSMPAAMRKSQNGRRRRNLMILTVR